MGDPSVEEFRVSKEELDELHLKIKQKADRFVQPILVLMFLFGLLIAYFYDTWTIALTVGTLNVLAFFLTRSLLPGNTLYQYVFSAVCAIFAAQYIYQMHGLAEMHFWVFISSTVLIIYQNWRLQLPLIVLVLIHHGTFAYLQFRGYEEIYFTQLAYMDLTAFIFHGVLASCVCLVSGIWGYNIHRRTVEDQIKYKKLEKLKAELELNSALMKSMNDQLLSSNQEIQNKNEELRTSEEELMASGEELKQINENLNKIVIERTDALLRQNNALVHHAYINAHNVRGPLARILGLVNLIGHELPLNSKSQELFDHLTRSANDLDDTLRQVRVSLDKAEFKGKD